MPHHLKAFLWGRRNKIAGEEVEIVVAHIEFVFAGRIPSLKPCFANLVWHVEEM
jgi:hypothetical protein